MWTKFAVDSWSCCLTIVTDTQTHKLKDSTSHWIPASAAINTPLRSIRTGSAGGWGGSVTYWFWWGCVQCDVLVLVGGCVQCDVLVLVGGLCAVWRTGSGGVGQRVVSTRQHHWTVLVRHFFFLAEDTTNRSLESSALLLGHRLVKWVLTRVSTALRARSAVGTLASRPTSK